jgi:hypothetical protein
LITPRDAAGFQNDLYLSMWIDMLITIQVKDNQI